MATSEVRLVPGTKLRFDHGAGAWVVRQAGARVWLRLADAAARAIGIRDDTRKFGWYDLNGNWSATLTDGNVTEIKAVAR